MGETVIAEFEAPEPLIEAARRLRAQGYRRMEAYVPYPIPELDQALGIRRTRLPHFVLGAAASGFGAAYGVVWWCNAHDYPINVGGRPLGSVIATLPIMFEAAVLLAALTAFGGALVLSGMPRLHDRMSEVEGIERTSVDRYWLTLSFPDPASRSDLRQELERLGATSVRTAEDAP